MTSLEELLIASSKDGRVCLQPEPWQRLWEMLPNRRRTDTRWEPALPRILAAWQHTLGAAKRHRFHEHLRRAPLHGASNAAARFLAQLQPEDWHTGN